MPMLADSGRNPRVAKWRDHHAGPLPSGAPQPTRKRWAWPAAIRNRSPVGRPASAATGVSSASAVPSGRAARKACRSAIAAAGVQAAGARLRRQRIQRGRLAGCHVAELGVGDPAGRQGGDLGGAGSGPVQMQYVQNDPGILGASGLDQRQRLPLPCGCRDRACIRPRHAARGALLPRTARQTGRSGPAAKGRVAAPARRSPICSWRPVPLPLPERGGTPPSPCPARARKPPRRTPPSPFGARRCGSRGTPRACRRSRVPASRASPWPAANPRRRTRRRRLPQ